MKTRTYLSAGVALALLTGGLTTAHAIGATVMDDKGNGFSNMAMEWSKDQREQFKEAYVLLIKTDHDYNGHRARAMEHLHRAADLMHIELRSWTGERSHDQKVSDANMNQALTIIKTFVNPAGGHEQEPINKAIVELSKALAIK